MSQSVMGITPVGGAGDTSITPAAQDSLGRSATRAIAPAPATPATPPQDKPLLFAGDDASEDDIFGGGSSDDSGSDESSGSSESSESGPSDDSSESGEENFLPGGGDKSDSSSGDEDAQEAIENAAAALEEHLGLHVEPGKSAKEFIEHLTTAAKNHKAGKDQAKEEVMGQGAQTGAAAGAPPGPAGGASEEQRPYLMSAAGEKLFLSSIVTMSLDQIRPADHGTAKVAQKGYRKDTRAHRERLTRQLDQLQVTGVPKADCDVLRKKVDGYRLSINDMGNYEQQQLDVEIRTALKMAKHFHGDLRLSTLLGAQAGVQEVPQPAGTGSACNDQDLLKLAQQRGEAMSVGRNGDGNGKGKG